MPGKKKPQPPPLSAEERYKRGDKSVLMRELYRWVDNPRGSIPEWLRRALIHAIGRARINYEVDSWDEVFGRPVPKGKSRRALKRKRELEWPVLDRVEKLTKEGHRIDKQLFEIVGKEFGVSGTVASEIYYNGRYFDDWE